MNVLQNRTLKKLRELGFMCGKLEGLVGWPDIIVVLTGGRVAFAEVKSGKDRIRPAQKIIHEMLLTRGIPVAIIRTEEDSKQFITDMIALEK